MIGVLVSGEGTNLQALVDDGLPIVAVASNKPGIPALARAAAQRGGVGGGVAYTSGAASVGCPREQST